MELQDIASAVEALGTKASKALGETRGEIQLLKTGHQELDSRVGALEQTSVKGVRGAARPIGLKAALLGSPEYIDWCAKSGSGRLRLEMKSTILSEIGSPPEPDDTFNPPHRLGTIVAGAFRPLRLLDLIPVEQVHTNLVEYTREVDFSNAAAETSEGELKPETDIEFGLTSSPVRTIAHWLRISQQAVEDAGTLAAYLGSRLTHGVLLRLEKQIVEGDGVTPNLSGILASGNHTPLSPDTGENALDFANRLKYAVIGADFSPSFYLVNPADWGAMERLKRGVGDDSYIGADGVISYLQNGLSPTLWGLPVIASNSVPQGTMVCASRDALMLWLRRSVVVEMFAQDEDNVRRNLVTVRAEMRAAFSVLVPAAVRAGSLPE